MLSFERAEILNFNGVKFIKLLFEFCAVSFLKKFPTLKVASIYSFLLSFPFSFWHLFTCLCMARDRGSDPFFLILLEACFEYLAFPYCLNEQISLFAWIHVLSSLALFYLLDVTPLRYSSLLIHLTVWWNIYFTFFCKNMWIPVTLFLTRFRISLTSLINHLVKI